MYQIIQDICFGEWFETKDTDETRQRFHKFHGKTPGPELQAYIS